MDLGSAGPARQEIRTSLDAKQLEVSTLLKCIKILLSEVVGYIISPKKKLPQIKHYQQNRFLHFLLCTPNIFHSKR